MGPSQGAVEEPGVGVLVRGGMSVKVRVVAFRNQ